MTTTLDLDLGDTRLILSACQRHGLPFNQAAYVLATACWETARTMRPVQEAFWLSEDWRRQNLRYHPWHGRGYVQLTWEANYKRAGDELGIDLIADPGKAMEPEIATEVLVRGLHEGWFTGVRLDDHLTSQTSNYRGARRIVNGTDRAAAIAEIARSKRRGMERPKPRPPSSRTAATARRHGGDRCSPGPFRPGPSVPWRGPAAP